MATKTKTESRRRIVTVDLTGYPGLFDAIAEIAERETRSKASVILSILRQRFPKEAVRRKGAA